MALLAGAAAVPFGRGSAPPWMVREAARRCLRDAGLEHVDHLVVANAAAEALCDIGNVAVWTASAVGLGGTPALRVETGPSSGLAALSVADALVESGRATNVLVLGWEVMTAVPTETATGVLSRLMAPDEQRSGLDLPSLVALLTSAYLARHELRPQDLARIPVRAHALAGANPIAQFREPITVEQVLRSRVIAEPIRLLHCAPMTDGAAAVVVADEGSVSIDGIGSATDWHAFTQRRTPPERFEATRLAARRAYAAARIDPADVDVAEVHDAFSVLEAVDLEDLGLAAEGHGLDAIAPPERPLDARPVSNPSGGLKARGHPVGATGVAQLVELYDQLTGRAANQVDGATTALAHNIGGFGNNVHCAVLTGGR